MEVIKPLGCFTFDMPIGAAIFPFSQNHIGTRLPAFNQLMDNGDGILQININRDNRVTGGMLQSGKQRGFFAEIAGE